LDAVPGNHHAVAADNAGLQPDERIYNLKCRSRQKSAVAVAGQVVDGKFVGAVVQYRKAAFRAGLFKIGAERIVGGNVVWSAGKKGRRDTEQGKNNSSHPENFCKSTGRWCWGFEKVNAAVRHPYGYLKKTFSAP
jgi:hypothetical protein